MSELTLVPHPPIPSWLTLASVVFNPLPVKDAIVTSNFTKFMVCAMIKDEDLYIDEWLEYHQYLGFDYVSIFDNADNASNYIADLPGRYPNFVTVVHSPGLKHQLKVYDACVRTFQSSSMWAAFIDVDEFIVLRKHSDIKSFVTEVSPTGGAIAFNREHFTSHHNRDYTPYPVLSRFLTRKIKVDERVKTIAYVPHVSKCRGHHCTLLANVTTVDPQGKEIATYKNFNKRGSATIAGVNHYFTKSYEEFKLKRYRGFGTHSELNSWYTRDQKGQERIDWDWNDSENSNGPTVLDTFAWDFYRSHKARHYNNHTK